MATSTADSRLFRLDMLLQRYGVVSPLSRAAVEGNSYVETGGTYSPHRWNPAEGALGLFQEEGPRLTALRAFAAARSKSPRNMAIQVQFAVHELRQRHLLGAIGAAGTPAAAAQIVQSKFEVSDPASLGQRQQAAKSIYQTITERAVSGGGAAAAPSVVQLASQQLGKPYAWDTPLVVRTNKPKTFDCSGLVEWSYWHAGVRPGLPHNAAAMYTVMKKRPWAKRQPGDAVFFGPARVGRLAYHVAVYAGNNEIIEAPDYGIPVRRRKLTGAEKDLVQKVGYLPGSSGGAATGGGVQGVGTGVGTGVGSGTVQTGLSWSDALPWNWGNAANTIIQDVITLVIKVAFAAGGIGLVILGINRAAKARAE